MQGPSRERLRAQAKRHAQLLRELNARAAEAVEHGDDPTLWIELAASISTPEG